MYQSRMLGYYPPAIQSILEFQAIIGGEYPEFKNVSSSAQQAIYDAYLLTMSEERLAQWEKCLGIIPTSNDTISDRRDVVIATIRGQGKLNTKLINKIVHAFTGSTAYSYLSDGVLHVEVKPPADNKNYNFENLKQALLKKVPAHLGVEITLDHTLWETVNLVHQTWGDVNSEHETWEEVLYSSHSDVTLDSVAWGGKTYREIFLTGNIFSKVSAITEADNSEWSQYSNLAKPTPTAEQYNTSPFSWNCSGTKSVQMSKDLNLPGDNFYIACKRKLASYTAGGWLGVEVYYMGGAGKVISDTVNASNVSETFETVSHTFTPKTATTQFWIGSGGSANLTGYVDDVVCINMTELFGDEVPTKAELNRLYENFLALYKGEVPECYYASKVIAVAEGEVGYIEKASNSQLDDKTANAGTGNYTKYARDLDAITNFYYGGKQGFSWCAVFVDWCFVQAYGVEAAKKLTYHDIYGAGVDFAADYYKNNGRFYTSNPQVGDEIFFSSGSTTYAHTGLVYKVDSNKVYTIEGNSGNCVCKKEYSLSDTTIVGYGRPNYDVE